MMSSNAAWPSPDAAEQLLTLDRARLAHELLRGIAHDLRNSMQVIALAGALGPDAAPDLAQRVEQALDDMTDMLDLLSRLGRHPGGEPERVRVDLVLRRVDDLARLQRNLPETPVRFEVAADLPPVAMTESSLTQAVLNVVTNAKEAQPDGAAVQVTASPAGDGAHVDITVHDRGAGPRLPERPLATTKSPATHGGTGLFAARLLLDRAGGCLLWDAAAGGGSRVTLRIPIST